MHAKLGSTPKVTRLPKTAKPWALTGWAQINGRDELPIPQKVDLDVEYRHHQSLWLDIKIIWLTFIKVLKKDGVSH